MLKSRRKKLIDKNAPSKPLNSYNLFCQRRVQQIKEKTQDVVHADLVKRISSEWASMPESDKLEFKKEADKFKENYEKSMAEYKKTKNYHDFVKRLKEHNANNLKSEPMKKKNRKQQLNYVPKIEENEDNSVASTQNIPIFTNEFLEHNKQREATLRQLRKQATQLEEETALLSKHVESLETGVKNITQESDVYNSKLTQLEDTVNDMRAGIVKCLGHLVLPTTRERISTSTVEEFLQVVTQYEEKNQHAQFVTQVKEKLATIDFSQYS